MIAGLRIRVVLSGSPGAPLVARVLERLEGSVMVRVPVLVTGTIDASRTAGGGAHKVKFTRASLDEMVENFSRWTQPVSAGFDGLDSMPGGANHGRDIGRPQSAFVRGLVRDGDVLYADVEVASELAYLVAPRDGLPRYEATSAEASFSPTLADGETTIEGWVFTGFVFTNSPATGTVYRLAAVSVRGPEEVMPQNETVSLTDHKAALKQLQDQIEALNAKLAALPAPAPTPAPAPDVAALTASNETLTAKVVALAGELQSLRTSSIAAQVGVIVRDAIAEGVAPALFDGHDAAGQDPATWLQKNYGTLDVLRNVVAKSPRRKPVAAGALAATDAGATDASNAGMAKAREIAASKGISLNAAIDALKKSDPASYAAIAASYRQASEA